MKGYIKSCTGEKEDNALKKLCAVVSIFILAFSMISTIGMAVEKELFAATETIEKDVLIIDDANKRALFGWYRAIMMPPAGWELLNRTILWAVSYMQPEETKIVLFTYDGTTEPDHEHKNDGGWVYHWLIGNGYLAENIDVHRQYDASVLPSSHYAGFNLVIYWNAYGYNSTNIVNSGVPFITVSHMQTDEMRIGTGIETMHQYRDTFYVVNNDYYPTEKYPLGKLLFESGMWTDATEAVEGVRVLVKAEVACVSPPKVEMSLIQDVSVAPDGSANMAFSVVIPQSPLADAYREAFFGLPPPIDPEVEVPIPENKTVYETIDVEPGVKDCSLVGDVTGLAGIPDGEVDALDLAPLARAYGSYLGSADYDPELDLNWDGKIDLMDLTMLAKNFRKTRPPPPATEEPVREAFYEAISMEQEVLLGFHVAPTAGYIIPWGINNETKVRVSAFSPQLARFDPVDEFWRIDVGPQDVNATDAASDFVFTKIQFVQMMLQSIPCEQTYVFNQSMRVNLPTGAQILNAPELIGLNWTIDFGGGTFMETHIALNGEMITVDETMMVTEQNITATEDYLSQAFSNYKAFKIDYSLAGSSSLAAKIGEISESETDWEKRWTLKISAGPYSKEWSEGPLYAYVKVTPALTMEWYVGWRYSSGHLRWFRTWMSITPSIEVKGYARATDSCTMTKSKTFTTWSKRFSWWIDFVPVWANLKLRITAAITANAGGSITFSASVTASTQFKATVEWIRGTGWRGILDYVTDFSMSGPTITGTARLTVTPKATCRLAFMFYDVAGPFVEGIPYAPIVITYNPNTWLITLKFKVVAGATFAGWLRSLLGLNDYSKPLADWELKRWDGTW